MSKSAPSKSSASRPRALACDDLPPPSMASIQAQLADTYDGEAFCRDLMEDIVAATYPDVVSAYMDELAVPWSVQSAMTDVVEALALAFLEREPPVDPWSLREHQRLQNGEAATDGAAEHEEGEQEAVAATVVSPERRRVRHRRSSTEDDGGHDNDSDVDSAAGELDQIAQVSRSLLITSPTATTGGGGAMMPAALSAQQQQPSDSNLVIAHSAPHAIATGASMAGSIIRQRPPPAPSQTAAAWAAANAAGVVNSNSNKRLDPTLPWSEAGLEPAPVCEPAFVPADSWCRASIQQRRRVVERRGSDASHAAGGDAASDAVGGGRGTFRRPGARTASGTSSSADVIAAGAGSSAKAAKALRGTTATDGSGKLTVAKSARFAASGSGGTTPAGGSRPTSAAVPGGDERAKSPVDLALEEERRMVASVAASLQRMRALRDASESVHRQLGALRGSASPFVIDGATNRVMEVVSVDPKALPPQRAEPRVALPDEVEEARQRALREAQEAAAAAQRGRARTPGMLEKRTKGAGRGEGGEAGSYWQPEANTNPMVAEVTPAAGVTHSDGESVRTTAAQPSKTRVSRQEFMKLMSLQATSHHQHARTSTHDDDATRTPPSGLNAAATNAAPKPLLNETTAAHNNNKDATSQQTAAASAKQQQQQQSASAVRGGIRAGATLPPRASSTDAAAGGGPHHLRHPHGGMAAPVRDASRGSTPGPGAVRPVVGSRPVSRAGATAAAALAAAGKGGLQSRPVSRGSVNSRGTAVASGGIPRMRLNDTDDDVARDFIASLVAEPE